MALIQKIYQQMEKIDVQISRKERLDEERYQDLERRMRKLFKKYNKVKEENEKMQIDSSQQLLSLQPSERLQVRSQAAEAAPTSCDFDRTKKGTGKSKSSKRMSGAKSHHQSRGALAKGSVVSIVSRESKSKPLSSVELTERSNKSVMKAESQQSRPSRDIEQADIQILEQRLPQEVADHLLVINNNSALSQSHGAQEQALDLDAKVVQANKVVGDEPLHPQDRISAA